MENTYLDRQFIDLENKITRYLSGQKKERVSIPGATIGSTNPDKDVINLEKALLLKVGNTTELETKTSGDTTTILFATEISKVNLAKIVKKNPDGTSWVEYILYKGKF